MIISVIIPTLNAEKNIPVLMERIWSQSLKPMEILIIDSSSNDNTVRTAIKYGAKTITIKRYEFDHGGTRNLAANEAFGDVLVFLTQDAMPTNEDFIENLVAPLTDASIPLSYGRQIPNMDANPIEIFVRRYNYPENSIIKDANQIPSLGIKTFFCSNVCSAIRRKEFEEIGRFPENIIMNEDMILAAKLILKGYKVAYQASATVYHSHNYGLKEQFQRYFDIGVSLSRNKWLLQGIKSEREGIKLLKSQTQYLIKEKKWLSVPYGFLQAVSKYSGYRLGLSEIRLPMRLKKSLSLHKNFWREGNTINQEAV